MANAHKRLESCSRCGGELPEHDAIFHRKTAYCSKACEVPAFVIGDGAAACYINDVYPMTIRRLSKSGHMLWASSDRIAKGHFDESFGPQADLYDPGNPPESEWKCFTRRADGYYRAKGHTSPVLHEGRSYSRPREI